MKIKTFMVAAIAVASLTGCSSQQAETISGLEVMYPNTATLFDVDPSGEQLMAGQAITTKMTEIRRTDKKVTVCIEDRCAYSVELPNDKFEQLLSEGRVLSMFNASNKLDGVTLIH
ncbi:hypothetical protein [Vibrio crassostreae]|uniref:hypothetical protein n=1 Tax=Vibrio crassostreae TaxID=246167 RepID=UPI001B30A688|nr:hypothetical protein [Vibrio crassostreae]